MKTINNKEERVEVMALFGYEMTPCQPLTFKRRGAKDEVEVTDLLTTHVSFVSGVAMHVFDVLAGSGKYRLTFNSADLTWRVATL